MHTVEFVGHRFCNGMAGGSRIGGARLTAKERRKESSDYVLAAGFSTIGVPGNSDGKEPGFWGRCSSVGCLLVQSGVGPMTCSHCEKPTVGAQVLCKKCLKLLNEIAPHLMDDLDSVQGINEALAALARAHDRQSYAQQEAYLKARRRRLAASR